MIYFIQQGIDGPVKIGRTENIEQRMKDLQTSNPQPLQLIRTFGTDDDALAERWLHERFDSVRLNGEWFEPLEEIVSDFAFEDIWMQMRFYHLATSGAKSFWAIASFAFTPRERYAFNEWRKNLFVLADRLRVEHPCYCTGFSTPEILERRRKGDIAGSLDAMQETTRKLLDAIAEVPIMMKEGA